MALKKIVNTWCKLEVIILIFLHISSTKTREIDDILVYTVATSETDGFQRYTRSAIEYGIKPNILGWGEGWKGGENIRYRPGGGWKINLLKKALEPYKDDKNRIVLFTDGYDVMFLSDLNTIIDAFKKTNARVLFGAESACWPDPELEKLYPVVESGKRFLNSGLYMGYAPDVYELLNYSPVKDTDDDQLFFTLGYLDEDLRTRLHFKLDYNSEIFQNLNGATSEVEMFPETNKEYTEYRLKNVVTHTQPLIVHGNGFSKTNLNALGNYLARAWTPEEECRHCKWGQIDLRRTLVKDLPTVVLALFFEMPTPFVEEYLMKIQDLEYPKERIHLFIHNNVKYHMPHVQSFVDQFSGRYKSFKQITPDDSIPEWTARDLSLDYCMQKDCDFYFVVDSIAHLDNPYTLQLLIEQNRTVVAPMLVRPEKAWSNFWGALTKDGFYARSHDYLDIVYNKRKGLWNVPFINTCYLVNATMLKKYDRTQLSYNKENFDADMAFCSNLNELDVFMYVSNRVDFGHLINPESYDVTRTAPDMYQIFDNARDWNQRYIHPDYPENFNPNKKTLQPCPDVYWAPIVTRRFCNDLISMMEAFGKWSEGKNEDERLTGGYEAVPTRDIHMNQVGWDPHWMIFLQRWVRPVQEHVFTGYFHDPPRSLMNFVVRYKPDEQPSLRPHHDSSTYTINIALNEVGKDYEGGGCHFLRYNCSVTDTKTGWMLIHPGRLTHYHEGLRVTKGIRYIMISFVDP
ncbi:hypothetical protein RN001_008881 [Aquatica leii]|uniref:Fe2OG dioxygenase domain-containing protein n=1 Tax=Aquatica leii TaxID=1421715 RepID=A0AAN7P4U0_9COLE|nr:hypothetical protein RN001_008881 [Aquatica leii]